MTKIFKISIGILLIFSIFSCEKEKKPLRVATNLWVGYEPLVLAKEKGFLNENVLITRMESSTDILQAFKNRIVDIATLTMDEILTLVQSEKDIQIFLICDISNGGDAIVTKPYIKTLKDLKGKKVAFENSALGSFIISRALDEVNLSIDEIEIQPVKYGEHEEVFKQNFIDAIITFEPIKTKLLKVGGKVVFDSTQMPNEIIDIVITRKDIIENRRDEIQNLVDGWFKTLNFINSNYQEAMKSMASYEHILVSEFINARDGIKVPSLKENYRLLSDGTIINSATKLKNFLLQKKILRRDFEVKNLFTNQFMKSQNEK